MRKYYIGPKKRITAELISAENGQPKYSKNIDVIKDNNLFYYNILGVLIEKNTGNAPILYDELYDLIDFYLNDTNKISIDFVDERDLKLVGNNKVLRKKK